MVSAKYAVALESISAALMSYFNFHFEKRMLNPKNTTDQTKITTSIHLLMKNTTPKMAIIRTAKGSKFQMRSSVSRSKAREKRFTFCTKDPAKLLAKKEYECSMR